MMSIAPDAGGKPDSCIARAPRLNAVYWSGYMPRTGTVSDLLRKNAGRRRLFLPVFRNLFRALWLLALAFFALSPAAGAAPVRKAAVFDFELIDTSLEGEKRGVDPAETARLVRISEALREGLAKSGHYDVVPIAPAAAEIASAGYLRSCNGCDVRIARTLGADLAVTGQIQKISTLILSLMIYVRDAETGAMLKVASADIRGNTDESWLHGVRWLVRNRLAAD
jgi:hypothetical protein